VRRVITPKYVARQRRHVDIEIRQVALAQPRTTARMFVEVKNQDDVSHYAPQHHRAEANAGE
jgi:hypothetical protein